MPKFSYQARDSEGRSITGAQEAPDSETALRVLQLKGLMVTDIQNASGSSSKSKSKKKMRKKIKGEDLVHLTHELSTLLEAGVSLVRAFEILISELNSQRLLDTVTTVKEDVKSGTPFHTAIQAFPKIFPYYWSHVIEAGEVSGKLPDILRELGNHLAVSEAMKKKVISAMIYPCVLMSVALGAILLFLLKIIPVFANLFESLDSELPALTQAVVTLSDFVQAYFVYFAVGTGIAVYFIRRYLATPAGRATFDLNMLRVPIVGAFIQNASVAQLCVNLSMMSKSGVEIVQSLDVTARATGNTVFERILIEVKEDVKQGTTLSQAMLKHELFPSMLTQMLSVGEEIGHLDTMLDKTARYYQDKVDVFIERIGILIEPFILIFVGSVIGVLVASMFLPIFSLSTAA